MELPHPRELFDGSLTGAHALSGGFWVLVVLCWCAVAPAAGKVTESPRAGFSYPAGDPQRWSGEFGSLRASVKWGSTRDRLDPVTQARHNLSTRPPTCACCFCFPRTGTARAEATTGTPISGALSEGRCEGAPNSGWWCRGSAGGWRGGGRCWRCQDARGDRSHSAVHGGRAPSPGASSWRHRSTRPPSRCACRAHNPQESPEPGTFPTNAPFFPQGELSALRLVEMHGDLEPGIPVDAEDAGRLVAVFQRTE